MQQLEPRRSSRNKRASPNKVAAHYCYHPQPVASRKFLKLAVSPRARRWRLENFDARTTRLSDGRLPVFGAKLSRAFAYVQVKRSARRDCIHTNLMIMSDVFRGFKQGDLGVLLMLIWVG